MVYVSMPATNPRLPMFLLAAVYSLSVETPLCVCYLLIYGLLHFKLQAPLILYRFHPRMAVSLFLLIRFLQ